MADDTSISVKTVVDLQLQKAEAQIAAFQRKYGTFKIGVAGGGLGGRNGIPGITDDLGRLDKSLVNATNRVTSLGAAFTVFFGIQRSFAQFIKSTIDVEAALARINVNLGASGQGLQQFSKQLFDTARQTGSTFENAAKAAEEFSRQGLSVAEVQKRTRDALILSRIAAIDSGEAVTDLTAAINTFNKEGLTSTDIVNKLAAVDTRYAVSSRDLGLAISRVGNSAQEAGVSFNELLGIVTAVQQSTQRGGAQIGNAFKTIFTRVSRPEVLTQLQELGVATRDLNNNVLPGIQILKNLADTYDQLSQAQKSVLSEQVGGVYQINILKAAVKDLADVNGTYVGALNAASNAQDEAFQKNDQLNRTLQASIAATGTSIKQLFSSIGNQRTSGILKGLTDAFSEAQRFFAGDNTGESIGETIGDGIVKGISNVLTGPVLLGGFIAISKGLFTIAKTFATSIRAELGLKTATEQRAQILARINELIAQANTSELRSLSNATSILAQREALLAVEQRISAEKARQIVSDAALASSFITPGLGSKIDPRLNVRKAAEGYVPALSGKSASTAADGYFPAIAQEKASVSKGVGGASAAAKPVVIPNFVFGQGKRGALVANTDEYIVPNYAGSGGSAIFNPKMVQKYGLPEGARKITSSASGYISTSAPDPNVAVAGAAAKPAKAAKGFVPTAAVGFSRAAISPITSGISRSSIGGGISRGSLSSGLPSRGSFGGGLVRDSFHAADGYVPNLANSSFGKYLSAIDPSYLKRFLELEKKDPALGEFLRKAVDQKNAKAVHSFQEYLGGKHVQSTPRAYGLDTTTYFDLDEEPDAIRAKTREVFQRFKMKSPLDNAASGYVPSFAAGPIGLRRGATQLGEGTFGRYLRAPDANIGFKAFKDDPEKDKLIRSEYAISKLAEELGLPVAKVFGSAKRSVDRGGLYKEHIEGTLGKDIRPDYRQAAVAVLGAKFQDKGIAAIDLSSNNFMVRKGAKLDDLMSVVKNSVVIDPGFFENINGESAGKYNKHYYSKAEGYVPNVAAALSREAAAGVNPRSIYIDRDPRVKSPGNPEGILVANRRDEPHGGYQGVNRVIRQGGNPRTAGALRGAAGGYVPSFAAGDFNYGDLRRSTGAPVAKAAITELNSLFETLRQAASRKDAEKVSSQIINVTQSLNEVSQSGVLDKIGEELTRFDRGLNAAAIRGKITRRTNNGDPENITPNEGPTVSERRSSQPRGSTLETPEILRRLQIKDAAQPDYKAPFINTTVQERAIAKPFPTLSNDQLVQVLRGTGGGDFGRKENVQQLRGLISRKPTDKDATDTLVGLGRSGTLNTNFEETAKKLVSSGKTLEDAYTQASRDYISSGGTARQLAKAQTSLLGGLVGYEKELAHAKQTAAQEFAKRTREREVVSVGQRAGINVQATRNVNQRYLSGEFEGPLPARNQRLIRATVQRQTTEDLGFGAFNKSDLRKNAVAQAQIQQEVDRRLNALLPKSTPDLLSGGKPSVFNRAKDFLKGPNGSIGLAIGAPLLAGQVDAFGSRFLPGKARGGTTGGVGTGLVSGALQGAGIGALAGPQGAIIGAAVGAVKGALGKLTKSLEEYSDEISEQQEKGRAQITEIASFVQLRTNYKDALASGDSTAIRRSKQNNSDFFANVSPEVLSSLAKTGYDPKKLEELLQESTRKQAASEKRDSAVQNFRQISSLYGGGTEKQLNSIARSLASGQLIEDKNDNKGKADLSKLDLDFSNSATSNLFQQANRFSRSLGSKLPFVGSALDKIAPDFTPSKAVRQDYAKLQAAVDKSGLGVDSFGNKVIVTASNFDQLLEILKRSKDAYIKDAAAQVEAANAIEKRTQAEANATAVLTARATVNDTFKQAALEGAIERNQNKTQFGIARGEGLSTVNQNIQARGSAEVKKVQDNEVIQLARASRERDLALRALIAGESAGDPTDNSPAAVSKRQLRDRAVSGELDSKELADAAKTLGVTFESISTIQSKYNVTAQEAVIVAQDNIRTLRERTKVEIETTEAIRRQTAFSNYTKQQGAEIGASLRGFGRKEGVGQPYLEKQDKAFLNLFENAKSLGADTSALKGYQNKIQAKENERGILDFAKNVLSGLNLPGFRNATFEKRDHTADSDQLLRAATAASKSLDEGVKSVGEFFLTNIKAQQQYKADSKVTSGALTKDTQLRISAYAPTLEPKSRTNKVVVLTEDDFKRATEKANRYVTDKGANTYRLDADDYARAEKAKGSAQNASTQLKDASTPKPTTAEEGARINLDAAKTFKDTIEAFNAAQKTFSYNLNSQVQVVIPGLEALADAASATEIQATISAAISTAITPVINRLAKLEGRPNPPGAKLA